MGRLRFAHGKNTTQPNSQFSSSPPQPLQRPSTSQPDSKKRKSLQKQQFIASKSVVCPRCIQQPTCNRTPEPTNRRSAEPPQNHEHFPTEGATNRITQGENVSYTITSSTFQVQESKVPANFRSKRAKVLSNVPRRASAKTTRVLLVHEMPANPR